MIPVTKGNEPIELKELRESVKNEGLTPKNEFMLLRNPQKSKVLHALKRDQGQLCVYCMCTIPREDKDRGIPGETIEHYIPLSPKDGRNVGQALDYQNLFAVCHGNTKAHCRGERRASSEETLTCDKHRHETEFLKIDPLDPETLKSITYSLDGRIDATDPDVRYDLVDTLNLNCEASPLIGERKAALDSLIDLIGAEIDKESFFPSCTKLLEGFRNETDPKTPYVGILIWYLQDMIKE